MAWSELIAIGKEAADMRREDMAQPIVECPVCGEPLDVKGEIRNCRWGHFSQLGSRRGPESV